MNGEKPSEFHNERALTSKINERGHAKSLICLDREFQIERR
jgi:hypothetical protein